MDIINQRVNYLISACAHRIGDQARYVKSTDILKLHLKELIKTDLSLLSQITILQSLPLNRRGEIHSREFWDIDEIIKDIPCLVEKLPLQDTGAFSYGLWVNALNYFKDKFDYYILIEDDYYPAHHQFVNILLQEHQKKLPNGGLLGSFVTDHAAVGNGIVDSKSFIEAVSTHEDIIRYLVENHGAQRNFSYMFNGKIADYSDNYRVLFNVECVECTHNPSLNNKIDIFNPIQYLFKK